MFALLGATIGISFDADAKQIDFPNPVLPDWLPRVQIANLRLGDASVDLALERKGDAVTATVNRRDGDIVIAQTD